jgi:hypothetical protein
MARLSALIAAALLFVNAPLAAVAGNDGARTSWEILNASRSYTAIPVASDDTINPLRGYYRWQNQETIPQSAPAKDAYRRYYWKDLESAPGQYNFSAILSDLATAKSQGRKFAFRVRMMAGYNNNTDYSAPYLANNPACQHACGFKAYADEAKTIFTWVPDWNDPWLLQRSRALLAALATALGADNPDLAWIDVGMYGQYGEFAIDRSVYGADASAAAITEITLASRREFAKMHFDAFPHQQHVMFVPRSNAEGLSYGLLEQTITSRPVGLRADCLSRYGYFDQWTHHQSEWAPFADRWKSAPFVSEFCPFVSGDPLNNPATARQQAAAFHITLFSNGNFETGRPDGDHWPALTPQEQADLLMLARESGYRYNVDSTTVNLSANGYLTLTATLRNLGSAPSYEKWRVKAELVNAAGAVAWSSPMDVDLPALVGAGASGTWQNKWTLPALPLGDYTLRLVARDTSPSPRLPLKWATTERAADGGLTIATLHRR